MMTDFLTRLRFLIRQTLSKRRRQSELDEESSSMWSNRRWQTLCGMSAQQAHRQALIGFGGVERTREQCTAAAGWWMDTVMQDVRYACAGFAAILSLPLRQLPHSCSASAQLRRFSVVDRILSATCLCARRPVGSFGLVQSLEKQEFTLGGFFYEWRDNQKPSRPYLRARRERCNLTERIPYICNARRWHRRSCPHSAFHQSWGAIFFRRDLPNGAKVL